MNFCIKCGTQLHTPSAPCPGCGFTPPVTVTAVPPVQHSALSIVAMVFMIVSTAHCAVSLYSLVCLAWCLPMTITYCTRIKNNQPVSIGFKVCSLIFVNTVAGILMLCDQSQQA